MRKLIALSLGLTLMTGCTPELLKSILSGPTTGTTQPSSQQPSGQPAPQTSGQPPSGQPGMYPPPPPPPQHKEFPQDCVDKYKALDTNGDGFVDKVEWTQAGLSEADFIATDRNVDGKIDLIDFCDKPADQPAPSGEPSAEPSASSDGPTECQTKFAAIDTNDNASADKEEWELAGRDTAEFDTLDTDDDGQVTTEEFCAGS